MRTTALSGSMVLVALLLGGCSSTFIASDVSVEPFTPEPVSKVADLNTQLGIGYLREGRLDLAYKRLARALDEAPGYHNALNAMGLLYDRRGETDKAEQHYRAAVRSNPHDAAALNNYGGFLCRHGRIDEAVEHFETALGNPLYDSPEAALTNAGLCMANNGRPEAAEQYLRRALEHQPRQVSALLAMSELSLKKGKALAARGYLQRYLEVARHSSRSLWLGVLIERELGDKNAVSSYAMLLKAKYPEAPETMLLLESEQP